MILLQTTISLPFGIFFIRAFFSGLLYDLTDAAKIDGCNDFGVFRRVSCRAIAANCFHHKDTKHTKFKFEIALRVLKGREISFSLSLNLVLE